MRHWVCLIVFGMVMAPACGHAETFFLKNGDVVEGTVLRSVGNTLSIKLDSTGMYQLPLGMIDRLEIATANGGRVSGTLAWWADGMYVLVTDQGLVEVKDGIVSNVTSDVGTPTAESPPIPAGSDQDAEQGAAAPAPSTRSLSDGELPQKLEPTM